MVELYTFDPLVPRPIDKYTVVDLPLEDRERAKALEALDEAKIFAGPASVHERQQWREDLALWREDARARHQYVGTAYSRPNGKWAQSCFTVAQVWLWDELLYSFAEEKFTPEKFLTDAKERFAGLDAVVLWHAYPIIGIDERNQWDYYRLVPGLADLISAFHDAGLKVFVDYNPWDTGTRRGQDDLTELSALVNDFEVDGVFLDTLKKAEPEFVQALEATRPGLILEGESKLAVERIEDHANSWAQFFADSPVPGILRSHWFERRHMQHHIRRWHRDHSEELQSAWLNGVGIMVWEVVFGVWVGWSKRDSSTLRRMLPIQRGASDLLLNGDWEPLTRLSDQAEAAKIYASKWSNSDIVLWTLVNRSNEDYSGPVLPLDTATGTYSGYTFHDLTDPEARTSGSASAYVPARSVGALLAIPPGSSLPDWANNLHLTSHQDDASFPHRLARKLGSSATSTQAGTDGILIEPGEHLLTVRYRARETGMYQGAPYVDEWKPLPPRLHDARTLQRELVLDHPVMVSAREVTNSQFAQFLEESRYVPATANRFLSQWQADGMPATIANEPVTFVDLEDARAYCRWVGGRLPTEDEWQLAASGFVHQKPRVWNWTESEYSDGRSRFVILKGGADYLAQGSDWYIEGGIHDPEYSVKFLLPGLGMSRSSQIGFRVAWDQTGEQR